MNYFICHDCGGDVYDDDAVHVLNRPFHVECAPEEDENDFTSEPARHPSCPDCSPVACDSCGKWYDVSSRDGRCGDCGDCRNCCSHVVEKENA